MIPNDYRDFFMAVVTSSASFIGLLFVAMSFIMDQSGKDKKQLARESMLSIGSYIALINLFIIALVALLPNTSIGHVMAIMGFIGLTNSTQLVRAGLKTGASRGTFGTSTLIYLAELIYGIYIIYHSHKVINETIFVTMVIVLFSSALGRAWELTGIRRTADKR
jgi:hypothetical protein